MFPLVWSRFNTAWIQLQVAVEMPDVRKITVFVPSI